MSSQRQMVQRHPNLRRYRRKPEVIASEENLRKLLINWCNFSAEAEMELVVENPNIINSLLIITSAENNRLLNNWIVINRCKE